MNDKSVLEYVVNQFSNRVSIREAAPGVWQLIAPFFYTDGDMMDIYLQASPLGNSYIRVTDMGMTLMRLSYANDVDSESIQKNIKSILAEQNFGYSEGIIYLDTPLASSNSFIPYFAQGLSKIMAIDALSNDVIKSYFYDNFRDFVLANFENYSPKADYIPVKRHDEYTVDYMLRLDNNRPIYLFPVRDTYKGSDVVGTLLFLKKEQVPGRSLIVYENFGSITTKTQRRLMNVSDKAFYQIEDFQEEGPKYIEDEIKVA